MYFSFVSRYNVCLEGLYCFVMAYVTGLRAPFSHVTWWGLFQCDRPHHFQVVVRIAEQEHATTFLVCVFCCPSYLSVALVPTVGVC